MIRNVNVCSVGQIQSGTSQSTGNAWRKQEFVVEWYESPSDTQSQKIVLSVMNDNIEKLKVKVGDKMEIRFDLKYREYNGKYYMDIYAPFDAMKKTGGLPVEEMAGTATQPTTEAPVGNQQQGHEQQQGGEQKNNDLPF